MRKKIKTEFQNNPSYLYTMNKKVLLMILDGWGITQDPAVSAIAQADTPFIDSVLGLIQQRGRVLGLYPTFAAHDLASDVNNGEDTRELVD